MKTGDPSGLSEGATLTGQISRQEEREAALIGAVLSPHIDGAGLTVTTRCSLVWPGVDRELVDNSGGPVGWGHVGTVERVHSCLRSWTPGDRVAGIGRGQETSSGIIHIPADLAAKVPSNVSYEEAALAIPGALAMRAVKLAGLDKGETAAVVGLGLTGRLVCRMLASTGCRILGLDSDEDGTYADRVLEIYRTYPIEEDSVSRILDITSGDGVDAVIITAGPESPTLKRMAGQICREKGVVVTTGSANNDSPGNTWFEKQLRFRSTGSFGPDHNGVTKEISRCDHCNEQSYAAVKHSLQSFLRLVSSGEIDVDSLITHRFEGHQADDACEMIAGNRRGECLGVLIDYRRKELSPKTRLSLPKWPSTISSRGPKISMGLIGASETDGAELLEEFEELGLWDDSRVISSERKLPAEDMGDSKFEFIHSRAEELITDPAVESIYIVNVGHRHSEWVVKSLLSGKATFVDNVLCSTQGEMEQIEAARRAAGAPLMVGYCRRFAPLAGKIREILKGRRFPLSMHYRINAAPLVGIGVDGNPQDDFRSIVYEICDCVDLLSFLIGGRPARVYAEGLSMPDDRYRCDENLQIMIRFSDGSVGTIDHVTSGSSQASTEYLEILGDGMVIQLDDFRSLVVASQGKLEKSEGKTRDTGRKRMFQLWHHYLVTGLGSPIPFKALRDTTIAGFRIMESLEDAMPASIAD
jgi:predicted dehydrogenase/NADPH:quinone reductase-like Zn-dependent oxidoreductase